MDWNSEPQQKLDPVTKLQEIQTLGSQGNHKSAKDFPKQVQSLQ
jgi:hypothetical protein